MQRSVSDQHALVLLARLHLANAQPLTRDVPFINLKVIACWVGLQLSPAQKPGSKSNYNTNLTFINYVGQSNLSWSVGCLPNAGGCDNVTFVGGVSQAARPHHSLPLRPARCGVAPRERRTAGSPGEPSPPRPRAVRWRH